MDRVGEPHRCAAALRACKPDRIGRAWLRATRKLARVAPARAAARRSDGLRAARRRSTARISPRASPRSPRATRSLRFGPRGQPPGHRRLRARGQEPRGVMRHAPQQHAADHEQQHQRDDRGALVVRERRDDGDEQRARAPSRTCPSCCRSRRTRRSCPPAPAGRTANATGSARRPARSPTAHGEHEELALGIRKYA